MNNRLKQFLAAENITQAQFADNLEVVRASVSHILSGRNNPGYDFIKALMLKYPRLNMEWLFFGKGKMYKDSNPPVHESVREAEDREPLMFPLEDEEDPVEEIIEAKESPKYQSNTQAESTQVIENKRKVSKIIILYDDGSYQEM